MTEAPRESPPDRPTSENRQWWRRLAYLPLTALATASVIALIVGMVASANIARLEAEPASFTESDPQTDASAPACRPPVTPADSQPWFGDDSEAQAVWAAHSDETAEPFVTGPNGWTFWSDQVDQYVSQAVGRRYLSAPEMDRWVNHLTALRDGFAANGVEFYVVVAPSTSSVYPEQLPRWMQEVTGPTILDQLVAASSGLPVIDLRANLIAQKTPAVNLFSWDNSHWTEFGAASSWSQIAECVNTLYPKGEPLTSPTITGSEVVGDFNEWASYGVESPGADWSVPIYGDQLAKVTRTRSDGTVETVDGGTVTDASWLPVETSTSMPWTGKSALIFRDSMGGGLSPLWEQAYSPTWQVWHRYRAGFEDPLSYARYVEEYDPDVVVLQLAERHLINPPPEGSGY